MQKVDNYNRNVRSFQDCLKAFLQYLDVRDYPGRYFFNQEPNQLPDEKSNELQTSALELKQTHFL